MAKEVTRLRVGARKDKGLKRGLNEDDFGVVEKFKERGQLQVAERKGNLFIVADGVGGHNAGEVASGMAVDIASRVYYEDDSMNVLGSLCRAVEEANREIYRRAQAVRAETGMGSTVVAAVIRGDELFIAHVGDSRAYLVRDRKITQLTQDHTWVSEQIKKGLLTPEEATTHPYRSYITRSLGAQLEVEVECSDRYQISENDIVLLCSDGLSGQVDAETMCRVVSDLEPAEACGELIQLANEAGGPDNIAAIVARVEKVVPCLLPQHRREKLPPLVPSTATVTRILPDVQTASAKVSRTPRRAAMLILLLALIACGILAALILLTRDWLVSPADDPTVTSLSPGTATPLATLLLTHPVLDTSMPTEIPPPALIFTLTPSATPLPPTDTSTPTAQANTDTPTLPPPTVTPTETATVTPTWTLTPEPTPPARLEALTNLYVRSGPGTYYPAIGGVRAGTELDIIGRSESGLWLKVCCVPGIGEVWISGLPAYVRTSVQLESLPVVPPP